MNPKRRLSLAVAFATVGLMVPAVGVAQAAPAAITLWTHNGGNATELADVNLTVKDFNASQSKYKVIVKAFPQASYNDAVAAAAASNNLPCIVDSDGPNLPAWVYAGYLSPLTLPASLTKPFVSAVKGIINGKLYSIGTYNAAVGLFTTKTILADLGLRTPTIANPWTLAEFNDAMSKAKASGKFDYALELGNNNSGEWWPYFYSTFLQSFGGDLINRAGYKTAEGSLNGKAAVAWGNWWQGLFANGLSPKNETDDQHNNGFVTGKFAFAWDGAWDAPNFLKTFGTDLVILPPPNLGTHPVIGGGSWEWAITHTCSSSAGANAWLAYALQTKYLIKFANDLGNMPVTPAAAAASPFFGPGKPFEPLQDFSAQLVTLRPPTPAYPILAKVFENAARAIKDGGDVQNTLDGAVDTINTVLKSNNFYKTK